MLVILSEIDPMVRKNRDTHRGPPYKLGVGHRSCFCGLLVRCETRIPIDLNKPPRSPKLVFGGKGGIEDAIGDAGYAEHFGYVVDADDVGALQDAGGDGGSGAPDF